MIEFMLLVILDAAMPRYAPFLLGWSEMGRIYGEWTWVGRFYE